MADISALVYSCPLIHVSNTIDEVRNGSDDGVPMVVCIPDFAVAKSYGDLA